MSDKIETTPIELLSNIDTSSLVKSLVNRRLEVEAQRSEISSKAMAKQLEILDAYLKKVEEEQDDFEIPELLSVMKTLRELSSDGLSKTSTSLINNQLINVQGDVTVNPPSDIISSLSDAERHALQENLMKQLYTVSDTDIKESEESSDEDENS